MARRPASVAARTEGSDAVDVERLERRGFEHPAVEVLGEERALDVVAREPPCELGEVVGAEGEEVSDRGDALGGDHRTWDLDHGADGARDLPAAFGLDVDADLLQLGPDQLELAVGGHQGNHQLDLGTSAAVQAVGDSVEQGARLSREEARDDESQPDAAQAQHRVLLVQPPNGGQETCIVGHRGSPRLGHGHAHRQFGEVG